MCVIDLKHTDLPLVFEMRVDFLDHTASTDTWGHRFHPDSYLGLAYDILKTKTKHITNPCSANRRLAVVLCVCVIYTIECVKYLAPPRLWSVGYSCFVVWYMVWLLWRTSPTTALQNSTHHSQWCIALMKQQRAVLRHKTLNHDQSGIMQCCLGYSALWVQTDPP